MNNVFFNMPYGNGVKRLFVTTGLISLINSQVIIKNFDNKNAQNFLIIYSSSTDDVFEEYNLKLMLPGIFETFVFTNRYDENKLFSNIDTMDFFNCFDEIYTIACNDFVNIYKHGNINLIEEGISSYFDFKNIIYKNVQKIFLTRYFGKIEYQDKIPSDKIAILEKNEVKDILFSIRMQNAIDCSCLKRKNQILFMSQYIYQDIMRHEDVVLFYKKYIDTILSDGYSILFKSHPRFNDIINKRLCELYEDNDMFSVFPESIKYPAELIIPDLDLRAVVTSMSGGAFNIAHLFDIPAYGFGAKLMNHTMDCVMKCRNIFLNYMPHISEFVDDYKFKKLNAQLHLDKVPKFTEIRLETSNICKYSCFMCPRKKMTRKSGIMSMENLDYVLDCFDYIKYELDFHLHGYGEALLCEDLPERCRRITARKPNFTPLIYTTLGCKKDAAWFESLFGNGLGKVVVSLSGYDRDTYKSVHGVDCFDEVRKNIECVAALQGKYGFALQVCLDNFGDKYPLPRSYTHKNLRKLKSDFVQYLHNLGIMEITGQILCNYGNGFENLGTLQRTLPCSIIWGNRRQHISISWDLNVCPCCHDYNYSFVWGNLRKNTLEEIYKSPQRTDFIKRHLNKEIPDMCRQSACFPNEAQHEEAYVIMKKFMDEQS